jgi:hypothetical protein
MTERMNYHVRVINKDDSVQEYDCSFYSVYDGWLRMDYKDNEMLIIALKDAVRIEVKRI